MSELPKAPAPADDAQPADSQPRNDQTKKTDDSSEDENPHIGDVLADSDTNSKRRE